MRRELMIYLYGVVLFFSFTAIVSAGYLEKQRRDGYILYKFKDAASDIEKEKARNVLTSYQAAPQRQLRNIALHLDKIHDQKTKTEEEICAELMATGAVEFAEPDYLVPPQLIPNDPGYNSQWFHTKINSPGAWDKTTGSAAVIAAVCDSGIQSTHPDLAANLSLPGLNTVDNTTNTEPIHSHGTAVAGCIGAIGNNAAGVSGMNWMIKILPVRITNRTDGWAYFSDMAEGINWATDQGARVINLSYLAGGSSTIDAAAKYARNKGALLFVSAGNDSALITYPDFSSFILVGATDSSDTKASWSNYGPAIDIAAPGVSIYTTTPSSTYASWSGTSFAAPISAGLAALIFSINPLFTPADVEGFIFSTCVDLGAPGEDDFYGKGRIGAAAAVAAAYNGPSPDVIPPASSITSPLDNSIVSGAVSVDISASDNVGVTKVELWKDNALFGIDTLSPFSFSWNTAQDTNGSHTLQAKAYDAANNIGSSSIVTVTAQNTADTTAPAVNITQPSDGAYLPSKGNQDISVLASDNVGVTRINILFDNVLKTPCLNAAACSYNLNVRKVSSGTHSISTTASDAAGNTGSSQITVYKK